MPRPVCAALGLALSLVSCSLEAPPAAALPRSGEVVRTPVPELGLPKSLPDGAILTDAWTLRSRLPITGLSAMSLQGERLMLGTDAGDLFETHCPDVVALSQCLDQWTYNGRLVARGAPRADLEALAFRPDGSVVLGLENAPRLALLEQEGGGFRIGKLPDAPNLRYLPRNAGPEAVAALPDGRLIVLPEGGVDGDAQAAVLVQQPDGSWVGRRMQLPDTGLLPTEASVAGDYLFVLLRGVSLLSGWDTRILALPLEALENADDVPSEPEIIASIRDRAIADNYEAMAARKLRDGSYTLLVASDDNNFALQQKLLLAFSWRPGEG